MLQVYTILGCKNAELRIGQHYPNPRAGNVAQGSQYVWKTWKTWKIFIFWKVREKSWNFSKVLKVREKSWNFKIFDRKFYFSIFLCRKFSFRNASRRIFLRVYMLVMLNLLMCYEIAIPTSIFLSHNGLVCNIMTCSQIIDFPAKMSESFL